MPCQKCENGKWKWGRNGSCKYNSKAECERANEGNRAASVADAIHGGEESEEPRGQR